MRRDKVIKTLRKHRQDLADRYGVASLALFGSVARDQARAESDVDLLVEFSRPVGLFDFIDLQQRLESILGCKVDLGTPRSLKLRVKDQVLDEAIYVT